MYESRESLRGRAITRVLHILTHKLVAQRLTHRVTACRGSFRHLPLSDQSVDITLSCSAFTSEPAHGGEAGLAELNASQSQVEKS